jgi:hypothetical protein
LDKPSGKAEREQSFPTAGRLPVAFRSLSATKVCSFFEIAKEKEEADKRLLMMEIVIAVVSTVFLLAMLAVGPVFLLR